MGRGKWRQRGRGEGAMQTFTEDDFFRKLLRLVETAMCHSSIPSYCCVYILFRLPVFLCGNFSFFSSVMSFWFRPSAASDSADTAAPGSISTDHPPAASVAASTSTTTTNIIMPFPSLTNDQPPRSRSNSASGTGTGRSNSSEKTNSGCHPSFLSSFFLLSQPSRH
jgi:hypothetical protein